MAVARDERLSKRDHGIVLPQSWGAFYELTTLDDAAFKGALTVVAKPAWVTAG